MVEKKKNNHRLPIIPIMNFIHTQSGESILFDGDITDLGEVVGGLGEAVGVPEERDVEDGEIIEDGDVVILYRVVIAKTREKFIASCDPRILSYWHMSLLDCRAFMYRYADRYSCKYKACRFDKKTCLRIHSQPQDINTLWWELNMLKRGDDWLNVSLTATISTAIDEQWGSTRAHIAMRADICQLCLIY